MDVFKGFKHRFNRFIDMMFYLATVMILVIFFSTCIEIFLRFFFNRPQIWTVEVTEYAMLYMTFLGAAWLLREEGHVRVDIILLFIKPKWQALLQGITSIFGIIICLVLMFYGTWSTWIHYQKRLYTFTAMELLKWPFLIIIPFGSLLLFIQFFIRTYGYLKEFKSHRD